MDNKPSALIIEDDRDIVALFRHVLDLAGYRTEIVLHGRVAVEHLAKSSQILSFWIWVYRVFRGVKSL